MIVRFHNGRIALPGGAVEAADIAVADGTLTAISNAGDAPAERDAGVFRVDAIHEDVDFTEKMTAAATSSIASAPTGRCRPASCPTPAWCRGSPAAGTTTATSP